MDFSNISDRDLCDLATNAAGTYDGLRIYGNGDLSELIAPAKHVWDNVRAEVERRGLGSEIGL